MEGVRQWFECRKVRSSKPIIWKKTEKRHERARNRKTGEKTKFLWTLFSPKYFLLRAIICFGPCNPYFFELDGVKQRFERRTTGSLSLIIWKIVKGHEKARNSENEEKSKFLCLFWHFLGKIFFEKNGFMGKIIFGSYTPYFFDLKWLRRWFERRKMGNSRSIIW